MLSELLPGGLFAPVDSVSSPAEARAAARERVYEMYFINAQHNDEDARSLAVDAAESGAVVLLLVAACEYGSVRDNVRTHGVLAVRKPVTVPMMEQAADFMCAIAERQRRLRSATASAEEKLEDMKLVNRAKWLLIDNLKMTEAEAHRYIERQAMQRCIRKREVAEIIIKTYKDS